MPLQRTLSIIKPDAIAKNVIGKMNTHFEEAGLCIIAARMLKMDKQTAQTFYREHSDRPFFNSLIEFMTSGPVLVQVLEGEDAVFKNRALMGATDPKVAAPGTLRAEFSTSIEQNAVHGSDNEDAAKREVAFFFRPEEVHSRSLG